MSRHRLELKLETRTGNVERLRSVAIARRVIYARPAVLNLSPCAPRSAYFACLSLLTHLIQIISSLEVCSVYELCSD